MKLLAYSRVNCGKLAGWTLMELLVAVAIGGVIMAVVASFSLYSLRSFIALSNYVDLDEKSRRAADEMTRQIRQATAVISAQPTGNNRWLTLTNSTPGATVRHMKYTWSNQDKVLYYERTGMPAVTNLTECDNWEFTLHQRRAIAGLTNQFWPATNSAGNFDFAAAKLVDMKWHCARQVLGRLQTESVQTTKIVLRNH